MFPRISATQTGPCRHTTAGSSVVTKSLRQTNRTRFVLAQVLLLIAYRAAGQSRRHVGALRHQIKFLL